MANDTNFEINIVRAMMQFIMHDCQYIFMIVFLDWGNWMVILAEMNKFDRLGQLKSVS